jgi:hypothetical protein
VAKGHNVTYLYADVRPADFMVPNVLGGKSLCCDLAVTDPLQDKYVHRAATSQCFSANDYAVNVKMKKYSDMINRHKDTLVFFPMVVETFGAWSQKAVDFFKLLVNWLSHRDSNTARSIIHLNLMQRLSCILQRGTARMLLNRI